MRYIVIGAGAVGGAIGGRLYASGHEVLLVARGDHFAALQSAGLRLVTPGGISVLSVPVVESLAPTALRPDDVLVLAVKSQDTARTLESWVDRPVSGGGTAGDLLPIVCAQNGVANERLALRRFRRVYGMSVWFPASYLNPGTIEVADDAYTGIAQLGRYVSGVDTVAERMAEDLEKSTFRVHLRRHIMYWKYAKLLNNLGNALEALIGPIEAPEAVRVYERAVEEGAAVLSAARITWATREEQAESLSEHAGLLRPGSEQRRGGSSWQSLARGAGSIEADYLNGEIVLLGREFGVPTPVNTFLQRAANRHARMGKAPGTVTVQEVLKGIARSAESCQVQ